jgi:hypothetical protein
MPMLKTRKPARRLTLDEANIIDFPPLVLIKSGVLLFINSEIRPVHCSDKYFQFDAI